MNPVAKFNNWTHEKLSMVVPRVKGGVVEVQVSKYDTHGLIRTTWRAKYCK